MSLDFKILRSLRKNSHLASHNKYQVSVKAVGYNTKYQLGLFGR